MRTVEWLGGPRDGERVNLPDTARYIEFAEPKLPLWEEVLPEHPVQPDLMTWRVPIDDGRLVWAKRRLRA